MSPRYRRSPQAKERRVSGSLFLAQAATGALFRANATVAAVWNALDEPMTERDLVALFRQAFPRVAPRRLRTEVAIMLRDLEVAGLIEPVRSRRRG